MAMVELDLAFTWMCPECRKRNFLRGIPMEWTDEDLKIELGLDSWEEVTDEHREEMSNCMITPDSVKCECGKKFKVNTGSKEST
jgi:hypothetical protein